MHKFPVGKPLHFSIRGMEEKRSISSRSEAFLYGREGRSVLSRF